jgi:hypothetical protein
MNSERQKREREVQRLIEGAGLSRDAEVEFQEEVKKTAAAIFEHETRKLQKNEPAERPKRFVNAATAGLWLIVLGVAGFVFWMPTFGAAAAVCGTAAIVWDFFLNPAKQKRGNRRAASSHKSRSGHFG